MAKIYISSTFTDLQAERKRVADAVLTLNHLPIAMEQYTATERIPLEKCLEDVRSCQVYIGVFAWRYGFIPENHNQSITELEYEEAGKYGIPRLIFLLHEDANWPQRNKDSNAANIRNLRALLMDKHIVKHFKNKEELFGEVIAAISKEIGTGRPIPDLLPYLANRAAQEYSLSDAIEKQNEDPSRPVLCVVRGDNTQSHDTFRRRIIEKALPQFISSYSDTNLFSNFLLKWPDQYKGSPECHKRVIWNLSKNMLKTPTKKQQDVQNFIANHPAHIVIHSNLLTENFLKSGEKVIDDFLHYWHGWGPLPSSKRVFIFLFIKYQKKAYKGLEGFIKFNQRRRYEALNKKIDKQIDDLDIDHFDNVICSVLPLLENISQSDTEDWAREEVETKYNYCSIQDLVREIALIYEDWDRIHKTDTIPMDRLAEMLKKTLYSCNHN